jgi:hypothetical protein
MKEEVTEWYWDTLDQTMAQNDGILDARRL